MELNRLEDLIAVLDERVSYHKNRLNATEAQERRAELNAPFSEEEIMALKTQAKQAGIDEKYLGMAEMALKSGMVTRKTVQDIIKGVMR